MKHTRKMICIAAISGLLLTACEQEPSENARESAAIQETSTIIPSSEAAPGPAGEQTEEIKIFSDLPKEKAEPGDALSPEGELFGAIAGSWKLDGQRTSSGLTQHNSLQDMFGTGLSAGSGLEISESGEMSYYIGIGIGGTGALQAADHNYKVSVTPYQDLGDYDTDFTFRLVTEEGKTYLVMDSVMGEELYWSRQIHEGS